MKKSLSSIGPILSVSIFFVVAIVGFYLMFGTPTQPPGGELPENIIMVLGTMNYMGGINKTLTEFSIPGLCAYKYNFEISAELIPYNFTRITIIGCVIYAMTLHEKDLGVNPIEQVGVLNTINKTKEQIFFNQHKNWFFVDKLNTMIETTGTIQGSGKGTYSGSTTGYSSGFIFNRFYNLNERGKFSFDFTGVLNMISEVRLPFKEVEYKELIELSEEYDKLVRCVRLADDNIILSTGETPYQVVCSFDKDNIQFISKMDNLLIEEKSCNKVFKYGVALFEKGRGLAIQTKTLNIVLSNGFCLKMMEDNGGIFV